MPNSYTKSPLSERAFCCARAALRRVMVTVLDGVHAEVSLPAWALQARTGRLSITLKLEEVRVVRAAASAESRSLADWITMLIRSRLQQWPLYARDEHSALLVALVTLSQLAHRLQQQPMTLHHIVADQREQ